MKMLIQIASVFSLLYRGLLQAVQVVASRARVASWSARDRQKGATALEYIVLAAAVIIIVGVLATVFGGPTNPLSEALSNLFGKAEEIAD